LRATTGRGARMSSAVVSRSPRSRPPSGVVDDVDRKVLLALQALVVGLPLCLGGRQPWAVAVSSAVVLVLLAVTIRARRRRAVAPHPPGIVALAGLVALAMATTLSLPPAMLGLVAPATARLYAEMLPGWPGSGGWTVWRPLAIDSYGVWAELSRLSIGLGAFLVTVAYPWRAAVEGEDARAVVFDRLLLTLLAAGALLAGLGLLSEATGNGRVLWITGAPTLAGRVSGPFVNPNHFAAWLETLMLAAEASPALTAEAYDVSLASRLAVAAQGSAIVRDHPLLGTGLGSWLPAFRPYQAPPVEGGIWDHAHNDYLELAAETGVAGMVLVLLFAVAILRAARGQQPSRVEEARGRPDEPAPEDLRRFALPVWRAALAERTG